MEDFNIELERVRHEEEPIAEHIRNQYAAENLALPAYVQVQIPAERGLLPEKKLRDEEAAGEPYDEQHRSSGAHDQDEKLFVVYEWLKDKVH
jgi:hypothetical protein